MQLHFSLRVIRYRTCQIVEIPKTYEPKVFAYAFQKGSPYLDLFNFQLNVSH